MATVNYVKHLNSFYVFIQKGPRLEGLQISLYMALFQLWNQQHFADRFPVSRKQVMRMAGIGSTDTYKKCLHALVRLRFIAYFRPSAPGQRSEISVFDLPCTTSGSPPCSTSDTLTGIESDPLPVPDPGHINKHINKSVNREAHAHTLLNEKSIEKGAAAPAQEMVLAFFRNAGYPEHEALKFFHHYSANGWLQSGGVPIRNWQAAAHKWMLNIYQSKSTPNGKRSNHLHTDEYESYSDPL